MIFPKTSSSFYFVMGKLFVAQHDLYGVCFTYYSQQVIYTSLNTGNLYYLCIYFTQQEIFINPRETERFPFSFCMPPVFHQKVAHLTMTVSMRLLNYTQFL